MLIRIRETAAVINDREFRDLHPNTMFPAALTVETLDHFGADPVLNGAQPTGEPWQSVVQDGVEQIGDQWFTKHVLVPETMPNNWLQKQKNAKLDQLADRRWKAETGGMVITLPDNSTLEVSTDRETQAKVTSGWVKAKDNPDFMITNWKFGRGAFGTLSNALIIAAGDAMTAHVQACFDNEATLTAQILAATDYGTLNAIDLESGWPL